MEEPTIEEVKEYMRLRKKYSIKVLDEKVKEVSTTTKELDIPTVFDRF